jgi:hypothetical protein
MTESDGSQNVYIAPEAFAVVSSAFPDQIHFWQESLPDPLKGKLASVRVSTNFRLRFCELS